MSDEIYGFLEEAMEGRAKINDFKNLMAYEWLEMAGEFMGVEEMDLLGAGLRIARKSAGKWVVS